MASRYRPLQVHSGSAPAQCLGSTEHTHKQIRGICNSISLGWPLFVNALLCCYCCMEQERIKLEIVFTKQLGGKNAEKELRREGGGHGGAWI